MQGLLGWFGNKTPKPIDSPANPRQSSQLSQAEIDDRDFPIAGKFDPDAEETNWDDAETLADENNPIVYAQPIVPVIPPTASTTPDPDDWDEALPAATVKNSPSQEVRRGKNPAPMAPSPDLWADDLPRQAFSPSRNIDPHSSSVPSRVEQAVGFWAAMLQQFRRFLPAPIRQLSDAILTAMLVMLITLGIWIVDGLFVPGGDPTGANLPPASVATQPNSTSATALQISPEQALIETIKTQLSDITSQYPDDIIQAIQVDVARDRLIVRLNPVWYLIGDEQQNRVTDRMWLQAKTNYFTKLELQDIQARSIARSPVVGQHMIILQRRQSY